MPRKNIRQRVLDAAIDLVASSGTIQLTLDAVAAHAGVSKGGLQHHFPSKTALLTAMVAQITETFEEEFRKAAMIGDSDQPADPLALYLKRSFSGLGARMPTAKVVFAVQAYDPSLLAPLRDYFKQRAKRISASYGERSAEALGLMLLADGLWMFDAIGAEPLQPSLRKQVLAAASRWAASIKKDSSQA